MCMRTGWSFLSAFGRLWGCERWLLHGTHVADGDCRERELLLVLDAKFYADRITEIFLGQLNDVVQQHCRHSHHHHQPEHLLESACSISNSLATGCCCIKNYDLHFYRAVKRVDCDKMEEKPVQIFIPYERSFSVVFYKKNGWCGAITSTWNFGLTGPHWSKIADFEPLVAPQP